MHEKNTLFLVLIHKVKKRYWQVFPLSSIDQTPAKLEKNAFKARTMPLWQKGLEAVRDSRAIPKLVSTHAHLCK